MKALKIIAMALILLLSTTYYLRIPQTVSAFYAKEFCSCYFVLERDEDFCHQEHAASVPQIGFSLDKENQIVSSGLIIKSRAKFTGTRFGCLILQD